MTRAWLLLTVPVALASILVSILAFSRIARPFSQALLTAPVLPEQTLNFPGAGGVALSLEGPQLTGKFRSLQFALIEAATGLEAPSRNIWFRFTRTTWHRARLEYRRFSLPRPGPYRLRVTGLQPGVDYSDCNLVFDHPLEPSSPAFLPFLLTVGGAILGLFGAIGGIVFSALILAGVWDNKALPAASLAPHWLTEERADEAGWQAVTWTEQNAHFRVPPKWRQTDRSGDHLAWQSPDPGPVTLDIRVTRMSTGVPRETVLETLLAKARSDLSQGVIEHWSLYPLGDIQGVLTLQPRQRGQILLVWEAFVGPPESDRSVTLVFFASRTQFEQMQPTLAAILDSLRIT